MPTRDDILAGRALIIQTMTAQLLCVRIGSTTAWKRGSGCWDAFRKYNKLAELPVSDAYKSVRLRNFPGLYGCTNPGMQPFICTNHLCGWNTRDAIASSVLRNCTDKIVSQCRRGHVMVPKDRSQKVSLFSCSKAERRDVTVTIILCFELT